MIELPGIVISSLLVALSMPGMLWGGLIWFALVPLFFTLEKLSPIKAGFAGFLFGYIYLMVSHFWVFPVLSVNVPEVLNRFPSFVGVITFFLMGVIMALPFFGFGVFFSFFSHYFKDKMLIWSVTVAAFFSFLEYLRSVGDLGFTGARLSDALVNHTGILQLSSIGGPLLLIFVIILFNMLVFYQVKKLSSWKIKLLTLAAFFGLVFVVNGVIDRFIPVNITDMNGKKQVSVIQTNFTQSLKYSDSTDEVFEVVNNALSQVPEDSVVIMPEATFMFDIRNSEYGDKLLNIAKAKDFEILIGFPIYEEKNYNQLRIINDEGFSDDFYAKVRLSPFAEFLPYPSIFGMFEFLKFLDFFSAGEKFTIFDMKEQKIGAQICFDSYYPEVSRHLVNEGAKLLVISTNDGWFNIKTGLVQHFSKARMRAVENRIYVIQVSNTGFTGIVDPYGRVLKCIPSIFENDDEFIIDEFEYVPAEGKTLYASFGAAIPWIFLGITVLFLIIAFKYGNNKRYIPVDKEKFLTGQKNNTK
ncbi:MAG: apolipoprotein N-acyltransferase [Kosmotogaceae bacterium]